MTSDATPTTRRAYHVLTVLGSGGFGAVYKARYVGEGDFHKTVALKVLHRGMEAIEEVAKRMRDEARVLGLVQHRAIVQVDKLARLNGRWTIVMEYVDGIDLRSVCRGVRIPPGPALEIISEVAGALHQAWTYVPDGHKEPIRILHRDIKPANIQLTALGGVKVLDFGIARADFASREAETRSLFFGSPEYTAPERFDQIEIPAGDIYSLGSVLFETLVGRPFGKTSSHPARHRAILDRNLVTLRNALGVAAPDIIGLIERLMAHDPDDRPSAREVERLCASARVQHSQPLLRDWAEAALPPLLETRKEQPSDDLTGTTLYEEVSGKLVTPGPRRKPPRKWEAPAQPPPSVPPGTLLEQVDLAEEGRRARVEPKPLIQRGTMSAPQRVKRRLAAAMEAAASGSAKAKPELEAALASPPPPPGAEPPPPPPPPNPLAALPDEATREEAAHGEPDVEVETDPGVGVARPAEVSTGEESTEPHPELEILVARGNPMLGNATPEDQPELRPFEAPTVVQPAGAQPSAPTEVRPVPSKEAIEAPIPPGRSKLQIGGTIAVAGTLLIAAMAVFHFSRSDHPSGQVNPAPPTPPLQAADMDRGVAADPISPQAHAPTSPQSGEEPRTPDPDHDAEPGSREDELGTSGAPVERGERDVGSAGGAASPHRVEGQESAPGVVDAAPMDLQHAGMAMVHVTGDELAVILEGGGQSYELPGWVPPGTYQMTAVFPGFGRMATGEVTIIEGATVRVHCDAGFGRCLQQ